MLTLYRRHRASCRLKSRRAKCSCPIWAQGVLRGEAIRESLDLTNWEAAQKKIRDWEVMGKENVVSLSDAFARFIAQYESAGSAPATIGKFRLLEREMKEFFGDVPLQSVSVDDLAKFRESWKLGNISVRMKIARLRSFFKFCIERDWIEKNPAKTLKLPKEIEIERKPYEPDELAKIEKAIAKFPAWGIYGEGNRLRLRAFISVLRWTGLRIGDVVQLDRAKLKGGHITLRTAKNGKRVMIPVHPEIEKALEEMKPQGEYFFWSAEGKPKSAVSDWQRTLLRLSKIAKVRIHAHRFRHTLAADLLSKGTPVSQVADILGNSPRIVEKHYSQWISSRQESLNQAVKATWS
jgi:integrase